MPPVDEFLAAPTAPQNFGGSAIGELEKPKEEEEINLDEDLKNIFFNVNELLDNYADKGDEKDDEEENINYQEIKKKNRER